MHSANEALAHSLTNSRSMVHRFTDDLTPEEFLHRPTPKANCPAWLIGHLALADRRTLIRLGASDLPNIPDGFEKQFSRDEGCPQADKFGDVAILLPIFDAHRDRLIDAVKRATPEQLNKPLEKAMPMFKTVGEMINFMSLHSAMHAGQITIIRRSLGKPPLI
jgi:hypothetical protein